ncbi:SEMA6 [Lepeophtheirus salmonis]|uniref:Semaphorin-1A n=1 Tax=Lepeophtheirus salmonis TaxID=72036 RepID=A0A7R8CLG6_LEPSM|nr:SEMA6 [Lepeophtheirus salmonis]CAF2852575.1 SEMA6 [Lepeophtheirus salmonis]
MVCAWQRNERPRLLLEMSPGDYVSFGGNESEVDYFRVMLPIEEGKYLLLGARNVLYKVELRDDLRLRQKLEWKSEERVREDCLVKGKTQRECQNYISVLAQYDQDREKYILCGTNAFKPLCREYTDERGTFADHAAVDPIIIRGSVKTRPFDSTVLNSPDFVGSFSDSDFVYFFFREGAVEYFNCGKAIFSRVARVCKNDPGGTGNHWMSFIKTRLNCSVPGAYPFYFDEIQGVSELILGSYGDDPQESLIFYATFSTPSNSIGGSAVCAYSIKDINKSFIGKFKEQRDTSANWLPVSEKDVPKPRPGTCINENDTNSLGDVNTNFIKSHTLMDETVPPLFGSPVVIRTGLSSRFTTLAVDPQISTTDGRHYDIIFTGTTNGYILKSINALGPSSNDRVESVIIEELKVFEKPTIIKKVQVVGVQRCDRATTCPECVALRDPYCAWDVRSARCGSGDWTQNMASSFIQSVSTGEHSHCLAEIVVQDGEEDNKGKWYDRIQPVGLVINIVNREKNSLSKPETKDRTVSQNNPSGVQGVEPNTVLFSLETLVITVSAGAVAALVVGFVIGYCCGRKCGKESGLARPLAPLLPTSSDKLDPRDQEEVTYAEPELVSRPVPSHLNALNSGGGKYYDGDRFGSSHYSSSLLQPNKFNTIHSSVSKRNKAHNDSLMLGGGGGVGGGLHFINDPPGVPATLFNAGNRREILDLMSISKCLHWDVLPCENNGKSSVNGDSSNDGSQPQVVDSAYGTTRSVKKVYL